MGMRATYETGQLRKRISSTAKAARFSTMELWSPTNREVDAAASFDQSLADGGSTSRASSGRPARPLLVERRRLLPLEDVE